MFLLLLLLPFVTPVFSDVVTPSLSPLISPAVPHKLSKGYSITKAPISDSFGHNKAPVNQTQFEEIDHNLNTSKTNQTDPEEHFSPSSSYDATIAPASSSEAKQINPEGHFSPSSSHDATIAPASSSETEQISPEEHFSPSSPYDAKITPASSNKLSSDTDVYNENGKEETISLPPSGISPVADEQQQEEEGENVEVDSAVMKNEGLKKVMDFNYKAEDEIEGFGVEEEIRSWDESKKDGVLSVVLVGVCVVGLGGFVYKVRMNKKKPNYYQPLSKRSISI